MKTRQMVCIFLIFLVITLPITLAESLVITNVRVEQVTQNSARVKWETNTNAKGSVNYGATKELGKNRQSNAFDDVHDIALTGLDVNAPYFFEVKSEEVTDNNNGNYYQFTTLPNQPVFIDATLPSYLSKKTISVSGKTIRLAEVNLFVNADEPRKLLAGDDGSFGFPSIALIEGENTIKLTAKSQGQSAEKIYKVILDTKDPILNISSIPDIVGKEKFSINGTADEPVNISYSVRSSTTKPEMPPKVQSLRNTSVKPNKVDLSWDKVDIKDFEQYIVYRNDTPLGIGSDSGYNDYSDVLANSGNTYSYRVAAMNKFGLIGEKSDSIMIRTPEGGRKDLPQENVKIEIGSKKTIEVQKDFSLEFDLGKEDGYYTININAIDRAKNQWLLEKTILLDTKDPEIKIISPKANANIFQNYADMVDISGKSEPGARIYLYMYRTPFSYFNTTWDAYGAPDYISQLDEAQLRANCRAEIDGKEQCKTHADYEAVADENGNFVIENVDLTSIWAGAVSVEELPTGEPYYDFVKFKETHDSLQSRLFFVAVDPAKRKGFLQADYTITTCWSPLLTWDATPLVEYQSPTFLSVERLKEGTEAIYFYLNFTYHGQGKDAKVTNLNIEKACGKGYLESLDRFNHSCKLIRSCTEKLSPNGKTAYVACGLGRLEGVESWHDSDWESFIQAVKEEMAFPFKLRLDYYDEDINNKTKQYGHYQICTEVSYQLDAVKINPREILPDWLLYDFTDSLNKSIGVLNDWILKIRRVLEWAALACMVTFFTKFVLQIYRRMVCAYDSVYKDVQKLGGTSGTNEECNKCIQDSKSASKKYEEGSKEGAKGKKDFQDDLSDACLKVCYPSCASVWGAEESLYQTYRWACDRVFGHPTPSKWTESEDDIALFEKAASGSSCATDQSVRGRPLRAVDCQATAKKYPNPRDFDRDDKCLEVSSTEKGMKYMTLYKIDSPIDAGNDLYSVSVVGGDEKIGVDFVIKQNEKNYLTHMEQTCEEICSQDITGKRSTAGFKVGKKDAQIITPGSEPKGVTQSDKQGEKLIMASGCAKTNECLSYASNENAKFQVEGQSTPVEIKSAMPMGYTSDCWQADQVSDNPDRRVECCCLNSKAGAFPGYYQPADVESKDGGPEASSYEDMRWSYRYYKMKYLNKVFNPLRYMQGRDLSACFGQDLWFYGRGKILTIDPSKQHIAAFQCVAISQILARLSMIRNLMVALENCLLSIRITGEADTGVCKEIFTQYICSFLWKVITWIKDGCLPLGKGIDLTESENGVLRFMSTGMKGVWDSVGDSQQELADEYGNAQLNNLLGMGEQDVFRKVCLAAFGYDWEINLDNVLDAAYHSPFATLVQPVLLSREYLTFDPVTYYSKYDYRGSWIINPGCDLDNYEVYLACVTRSDLYRYDDIDCAKQSDPEGSNCDCLGLPPDKAPQPMFFYGSRGRIKQNELINIDSTMIKNRIKSSAYRYDHLVFKLNVDRNMKKNNGDTSKCFTDGHEDGTFYFPILDFSAQDIASCTVDATTGRFVCNLGPGFGNELGTASMNEVTVADSLTKNILEPNGASYYAGDSRPISATVSYLKDEPMQCLIGRLYDRDRTTILDNRFVKLPKNQLSGQEIITMKYMPSQQDVPERGYGFYMGYLDDKGDEQMAIGKLQYTPVERARKMGGGPLKFIDDPSNGPGVIVSRGSTDKFIYGNKEAKIGNHYVNGGLLVNISDMEASVSITTARDIPPTSGSEYNYFIRYTGSSQEKASKEPRYWLHLDIRSPKTPDGNCQDVMGMEYDKVADGLDQTQVVISSGIRQEVDIPIYILPGMGEKEKCSSSYQLAPIQDNVQCACEDSSVKNCPDKNGPGPQDDFNYCYNECRKYNRCMLNAPLDAPCVCSPDTRPDKYDCGVKDKNDANAYGINSMGKYCYEENSVLACRSAASQAGPEDTTPLTITWNSPQDNYMAKVNEVITIYATISDDKVSGKEEAEIWVKSPDQENIQVIPFKDQNHREYWAITKDIQVKKPGEMIISIYAKDPDSADPRPITIPPIRVKVSVI